MDISLTNKATEAQKMKQLAQVPTFGQWQNFRYLRSSDNISGMFSTSSYSQATSPCSPELVPVQRDLLLLQAENKAGYRKKFKESDAVLPMGPEGSLHPCKSSQPAMTFVLLPRSLCSNLLPI